MLFNMKKIFFVLALFGTLAFTGLEVFAQSSTPSGADNQQQALCVETEQLPCVSNAPEVEFSPSVTINNPLGAEFNNMDILDFLKRLFENFVKIALPFLVLFTMWAGLQFVLARGNEDKLSEAKQNFLYVIIGTAIVFSAWGLANILAGTVEQFEAFEKTIRLLV
jgi:hypothetical protein